MRNYFFVAFAFVYSLKLCGTGVDLYFFRASIRNCYHSTIRRVLTLAHAPNALLRRGGGGGGEEGL